MGIAVGGGIVTKPKLGATGRYPFGKVGQHDAGELRLGVAVDHQQGIVHIDFGTPVTWIGLEESKVREFAAMLIEKADELKARRI